MTNPLQNSALIFISLLGTAAIAGEPPEAQVGAKKMVMSVEAVTVRATEGNPTQIAVEATGMVNSGGWSEPALRPVKDAAEGTLTFEFVASPPLPGAIVTQALVKVRADISVEKPANYREVKVVARGNAATAK